MLRLRRSHHQPLLHQSLQQHPVWNGGKNGAQRGALVVRSDVKHDAPVVWSDVRRGEPLASSDVRHGAADCTCSPTSPQNNNSSSATNSPPGAELGGSVVFNDAKAPAAWRCSPRSVAPRLTLFLPTQRHLMPDACHFHIQRSF